MSRQESSAWTGSWHNFNRNRRSEESREGERFNDDDLMENGYRRTAHKYTLPDGTLLYIQYRYVDNRLRPGVDERKKQFRPCRPFGTEGNFINGPGERKIIYNWPAIVKAGPSSTVFVTEGEKNADDIIAAGLLATTVISHKWTKECAAALSGFHVIILEDNDDDGREQAAKAREALAGVAESLRVVPFAHLWKYAAKEHAGKDPPVSADISDWVQDYGGDITKLTEICRGIPAEGEITAEPHAFPEERTIAPRDFLYGKHLLRKTVSGTAATGGTGKSSFSIVEAISMTIGKKLVPDAVGGRMLRVVLINLEDDRNTMDKRIAAVMKHYRISKEEVGDRLIVLAKDDIKRQIGKMKIARQLRSGDVERNELLIKALTKLMLDKKADVLSIDSFIRTHSVHENDNSAIEEVIECFEEIASDANCTVHLWHHTRKDNGQGATVDSSRGAKAFIDALRSVRILEKMTNDDARKLQLEHAAYYFRSFSGKLNFAPPIEQSDWFKIESVNIENAFPFGDDVGVVTAWQHPGTKTADLSPGVID